MLAAYGPVLSSAAELVAQEVGVVPSSRVKNTGTILEKLHRSGGHTLGSIYDLGGMRLVVDGGRVAQDQVAAQVLDLFANESRGPRLIDRRARPVQGYRAVHVIIYPDGYPIEVQVRPCGSTCGLSGLSDSQTSTDAESDTESLRRPAVKPSRKWSRR